MTDDDAAKRIAELERQLAELKATLRADHAAGPPPQFSAAQDFMRAAAGGVPINTVGFGQQVGWGPSGQRKLSSPDRFGLIIGLIGGGIGGLLGGVAALTAVFPSTALWTSAIVCRSQYHLVTSTSSYSYKPGQSGTNVTYRCVSDAGWYDVNVFVIFALQSLLAAVIVCGVAVVVLLMRRRARNR